MRNVQGRCNIKCIVRLPMPYYSAIAICVASNCSLIKSRRKKTANPRMMCSPLGIHAAFCSASLLPTACSHVFRALEFSVCLSGKVFLAPPHHHSQSHLCPLTRPGWPYAFATRSFEDLVAKGSCAFATKFSPFPSGFADSGFCCIGE